MAALTAAICLSWTLESTAQNGSSCESTPDVVFHGGVVVTMDADQTTAEAIAIKTDTIMAVGSDEEVLALIQPDCPTAAANLNGRVLLPGFNDSHAHWFSWPEHICSATGTTTYPDLAEIMRMLSRNGWTSFSELNFGRPDHAPAHFDNAMGLDAARELSVRINGYWGTYDDPSMIDVLSDAGRTPDARYSDRVKATGVKMYVDNPFGDFDLMSQAEVDVLVEKAHQAGWQVAAHAVNESAVEKILTAYENMLGSESNAAARHRIEHAVKVSDDQLMRMQEKGIIASFQLLGPADWPSQTSFGDRFLTSNPEWVMRWKDFTDAGDDGFESTGSSDAPFNDAPCEPSPFRLIYQSVTRDGYVERTPADWELAQRLAIEDAVKLLTIDAAYATFDEDQKGSLETGKWADFVILSDNPLDVLDPNELLEIDVLLTSVGGETEFCDQQAAGDLCSPSVTFFVPNGEVRASNYLPDQTPDLAFDGSLETNWGSGGEPPQWVELTLDDSMIIGGIELATEQSPDGRTVHEIWAGESPGGELQRIHRFGGTTTSGQTLLYEAPSDLPAYRVFRIHTATSPSWVSWREITLLPVSTTAREIERIDGHRTEIRHFPNPAGDRVTIVMETSAGPPLGVHEADLTMYDIFGRVVRTWTVGLGSGNRTTLEWDGLGDDGRPLANGLYLYRLSADGRSVGGRIVLNR